MGGKGGSSFGSGPNSYKGMLTGENLTDPLNRWSASKQSPFEKSLNTAGDTLFDSSLPVIQSFLGGGADILAGGDMRQNAFYNAMMNAGMRNLGDQYGMAAQQIGEAGPVGNAAAYNRGMQNAALGAAEAKGGFANMAAQQLMQNLLAAAQAGTGMGIDALTAGGNQWTSRYNTNQEQLSRFNESTANFFKDFFGS